MARLADKIKKAGGVSIAEPKWDLRPEILLCQNIPKPLHGLAPRVVLGSKWWDETRKKAYASTGQHCVACGVHKNDARFHRWLEGHEVYKIDYARGRAKYVETVPLCPACHAFIHDGRLRMLMESGQITQARFVAIIQHGNRVLAEAGLSRPIPGEREVLNFLQGLADWKNWRLVIGRKHYGPAFKSLAEWNKSHATS